MQDRRLRALLDAEAAAFGALLRRLRESQTTYARRTNQWGTRWTTVPLSQNALAGRAGVDAAHVSRLERGATTPSRAVAEKLAEALELDDVGTSRLLIAAGYWPWHELDEDTALLVAQTALAVVAGDYRRLEDER
ncbi:MAG TPA: helix-turn-helix transcriptional regulator [Gemmatimonadales bacterium]|nr:helix-turn-helix transcriptional regulator [Gemmatimonadales bacterium]